MHIGPQEAAAATSTVHLHWLSCPVPSNVSEWLSRPSVLLEAALEEGGECRSRLNNQPFVC